VNVEAQRIQDQLITALERSKQQFADLARTKGWGEDEIGWNLSPSHAQAVLKMYEQDDLDGLTAEASRQRTARPYDPFIALEHNILQAIQDLDNAALLDRLSADSYSLKQLIPEDDVYSEYKFYATSLAAFLASEARAAERKGGASPDSSRRSRRAVELWEEAYRLQPSGPGGQVRLFRGKAYASDGDTDKALRELSSVFAILKENGDFLYAFSWVSSLHGDHDVLVQREMDCRLIAALPINGIKNSFPGNVPGLNARIFRFRAKTEGKVGVNARLTPPSVSALARRSGCFPALPYPPARFS